MQRTSPLPPGPRGVPLIRALRARRDPFAVLQELVAQYGDVVLLRIGRRRVYLINDTALIEEALVEKADSFARSSLTPATERLIAGSIFVSYGKEHARKKRAAMPLFGHERVEFVATTAARMGKEAAATWPRDVPVELMDELTKLSIRISVANLFSITDPDEVRRVGEALEGSMEAFERPFQALNTLLERLPVSSTRRIRESTAKLCEIVDGEVQARIASPGSCGDLLDMLAMMRFDDGGPDRLTPLELRSEAIELLVGSYATIAAAVGWTLYELACHPDEQARLAQQLRATLKGEAPSMANFKRLGLARAAFTEGLRLHPPAWAFGRRALEPVRLGRWSIPAGSVVVCSPRITQRDARNFPDPQRFDMGRWQPGAAPVRPYAYIPFGAGPRSCLGEGIAMALGTIILARLVHDLEFFTVPGAPAQEQAAGLQPKGRTPMILRERGAVSA